MTGIAAAEAQEGERLSCRGEKLLTVRYAPPGETKAVLVWHHGYGEHVGRYKWGASKRGETPELSFPVFDRPVSLVTIW